MKFRTQPNEHTCGAIAVINCMTLLGAKPHSLELVKGIVNNDLHGTWVKDLERGTRAIGMRFKRATWPLDRSKIYILLLANPRFTYRGKGEFQHYVVLSKYGIHNNYDFKKKKYTKCSNWLNEEDRIVSVYETY